MFLNCRKLVILYAALDKIKTINFLKNNRNYQNILELIDDLFDHNCKTLLNHLMTCFNDSYPSIHQSKFSKYFRINR